MHIYTTRKHICIYTYMCARIYAYGIHLRTYAHTLFSVLRFFEAFAARPSFLLNKKWNPFFKVKWPFFWSGISEVVRP